MSSSQYRASTRRRSRARFNPIEPGLIFQIARDAGIDVPPDRDKFAIRCPFHDDRHPSAVLFAWNGFHCSSCGLTLTAKDFALRLGIEWRRSLQPASRRDVQENRAPALRDNAPPLFTATDAQRIWSMALARAQSEPLNPQDLAVHTYLASRGLLRALETGCAGILSTRASLPPLVAGWFYSGHRLIAPLFNASGELVNIQSRAIVPAKKKTLFVEGSRASGTMFVTPSGLELLRGTWTGDSRVLYGEGLTDSLAYAIGCPFPALAAPGTPMYVAGIGSWARGRHVLLAMDCDPFGDAVVNDAIAAAYRFGALRVTRLRWPKGAKDACDVLLAYGEIGLRRFLERAPGGAS